MGKLPKWKISYLELVKTMSNEELYEDFIMHNQPDDYDGMFTPSGDWQRGVVTEEFEKRLKGAGFLK